MHQNVDSQLAGTLLGETELQWQAVVVGQTMLDKLIYLEITNYMTSRFNLTCKAVVRRIQYFARVPQWQLY